MEAVQLFRRLAFVIVACSMLLLFIQTPVSSQTLVTLPLNTGPYYGITVWGCTAHMSAVDTASIYGFGVNLKYSPLQYFHRKTETHSREVTTSVMNSTVTKKTFTGVRKETESETDTLVEGSRYWTFDTNASGNKKKITATTTQVKRENGRVSLTHYDTITQYVTTIHCDTIKKIVCSQKDFYYLRASVGLGYLEYYNLELNPELVAGKFNVGAPYVGVYISLQPEDWVSLSVAYTSSFPSAEVIAKYVGVLKDTNLKEKDRTNFPISYKLPTTPMHDLGVGIVLKCGSFSIFGEWFKNWYYVSNVKFDPITGISGFPKQELQNTIGSDFNLSFEGFKGGLSFSFN